MSYSSLTEKEWMDILKHAISESSQDHRYKRIDGLVELQKRIQSNSIQNMNDFLELLLEMAITHGKTQPETSLIVDSLIISTEKNDSLYEEILNRLKGQEGQLFIVFAELVTRVDYKQKKMAIKPLIDFIVRRENITDVGVNEVYQRLVSLGNQHLSEEIVNEASPHLDSIRICAILFSVRLCSEFADQRILPQMSKVLEKSMKGFFNAHHTEIEKRLCSYFKRIKDQDSFPHLMKLIKLRYRDNPTEKSEALGEILDAHPFLMEDVLDAIYDAGNNKDLVTVLLHAIENVEKPPFAKKLLSKIRIRYWWESPARFYLKTILAKGGESSKPILLEMLKDSEKHEYALECLKEIGLSPDEVSNVIPKSPILQIYEFFYAQVGRRKMPNDLNVLWQQKDKLGENVPGTTQKLEHLILHILSSFNFVTLNVAPLKFESRLGISLMLVNFLVNVYFQLI